MNNSRKAKNIQTLAYRNIRAIIFLTLLSRPMHHCVSSHGIAAHFYMKHKAEIEQKHILSSSIFSGTAKYGFGLQSSGINSGLPIFGILSAKINLMESINAHKTTNINLGINYTFNLSANLIKDYMWSTLSNNNQQQSYLNNVRLFFGIKTHITKNISIYCDIRYPLINLVNDNKKMFDTTFDASATLKYGKQHFNAYLLYRIIYNKTHNSKAQFYHTISFGIKIFKKHKSVYTSKKQNYFTINITNRSNANMYAEFNLCNNKYDIQQNILDEIVPQILDKCVDVIKKKGTLDKMIEPILEKGVEVIKEKYNLYEEIPKILGKCVDAIYKHQKYGARAKVLQNFFEKAAKFLLVNPKKIILEHQKYIENNTNTSTTIDNNR